MSDDLAAASAVELAELVRRREVSPVELVDLYASRIEEHNPQLGAYLTLALEGAREDARRIESAAAAGAELPPFAGVPISIKDLNDTAGIRTTHGCAAFSDRVPSTDAGVVQRIRRAGFVVLGKTNTPEFGTSPWTEPDGYPPARNPWDLDRTPGGSSGGAAAAVAASLCPVAQGSDGGGSIRIPASCCGLYGIKPSRGRVSGAPGSQSFLSQAGPLAWTVADAAAFLDTVSGYEAGDAWWAPSPGGLFSAEVGAPPGRMRIAFTTAPPSGAHVAPGNSEAAEAAARLLADLGHEVDADAPPPWPESLAGDFGTAWMVRTASYEPMPPLEELGPLNRRLVELGREIRAPDYERSLRRIQRAARSLVAFFDTYDVLLTPTVALPPPRIGEYKDPAEPLSEFTGAGNFVPFTPPWNTTGQPAVSVPLATDDHGLPVGVQLVGQPAGEAALIRLSAQLEEASPWIARRPPIG